MVISAEKVFFKWKCRREEVIISRLRLGHTGFKINPVFNGKMHIRYWDECNFPENVEHIIMRCKKYIAE